ncbi:MAG TPA: hypothetical protein G4O18_06525 [Dehalococcoidia bacterium]|nr:hypothetical protein [Dehalococcoidia bacterium]
MPKAKCLALLMLGVLLLFGACKDGRLEIEDAAGARDAALEYIREHYPEDAPETGLEWQDEDITPKGLVGISIRQYTTDGLTVKVSAPVVAPENIIYTIAITSMQGGWYWQGEVKPNGTVTELSPLTEMTEAWSLNVAEEFVRSSPTFSYDGIEETLELTETLTLRCPYCWSFIFEFDCLHAGYGDRTGEVLAQVITHHEAVITVIRGEVTSAIIDDKWDMLQQEEISD